MTERDQALLGRALHEALRAEWLFTAPNPRVGALALRGGHVVGYGHHARLGGPHAEEAALHDAGAWDAEAARPLPGRVDEMVVTLEPCSAGRSDKRRPACAELLQAAGVRRLVIGSADPDPRQAKLNLAAMRAAGIEVVIHEREQVEALAAFRLGLRHAERPFTLLKWAASVDGKIAAANGASQWITGPQARAEVHELRALSDGILCGRRTLLGDDPSLTARPDGEAAVRQPLRILLDAPEDLRAGARVLAAPGPRLWVTGPGGRPPREAPAADAHLVVPRDSAGRLALEPLFAALRARHGVRRLLVEGGALLHGAILDQRLADAIVRYEAPMLLGGARSACAGVGALDPDHAPRLLHEERRDLGPDLRRAFLLAP